MVMNTICISLCYTKIYVDLICSRICFCIEHKSLTNLGMRGHAELFVLHITMIVIVKSALNICRSAYIVVTDNLVPRNLIECLPSVGIRGKQRNYFNEDN